MLVGVLMVITGLCLWKPMQFSELAGLFGNFQTIRLIHFLCMSAIVLFVLVHVTLALLVPQGLLAMLTGGPTVSDMLAAEPAVAQSAAETTHSRGGYDANANPNPLGLPPPTDYLPRRTQAQSGVG